MFQIQQIPTDTRQKQSLILEDGTIVAIEIYFVPMQFGWFITELTYGDFILRGVRICNSPNLLHQYRNVIPFGLACFSKQEREPMFQDDFQSGASKLYILTQAECQQYAEYLSGQV